MTRGKRLPHVVAAVSLTVLIVSLVACGTAPPFRTSPGLYNPLDGIPDVVVIGAIQTDFPTNETTIAGINRAARAALIDAVRALYGEGVDVDVADITWVQTQHRQAARAATEGGAARPAQAARFFAVGVIAVQGEPGEMVRTPRLAGPGIQGALERAIENIVDAIPAGARVAILYMSGPDTVTTEFLTGELAHILSNRDVLVIDLELDRLRAAYRLGVNLEAYAYVLRRLGLEQYDSGLDIIREGPGLIGTVDSATAARIGLFTGANVVLIGGVDGGTDEFRRLRLRAVNTATEQIIATASERIL